MYIKRWFLILVLATATISTHSLAAQESERPLVVFIINEDLQTSSVRDPGPYGLSQLEQIFISLGAQTGVTDLKTPLPEDADVVVLVGPKRRLPGPYVANLWTHLNRGNHLLLAIDPPGQFGIYTDQSTTGLTRLLNADFGIELQDALVAEQWFTNSSIAEETTTFSRAYPETILHHPLVSPLIDFDLPVEIWGARTLVIEPDGVDSQATPLLVTSTAFGETNQQVFATDDQVSAPVEINPTEDVTGTLIVGALAENTRMGSRIVVLGDSEIVKNDFGLGIKFQPTRPLHPGNQIFAEQIASWLLGLPTADTADLYESFTGIMFDGQIEDWPEGNDTFIEVDGNDDVPPEYDIQRVGLLHDTGYLYLAIETTSPPPSNALLKLEIVSDSDDSSNMVIWFNIDAITLQQENAPPQQVPDGKLAVATVLEARLPLRFINDNVIIDTLCLTNDILAESESYVNCITPQLKLGTGTNTTPLVEASFPGEPLATVLSAEARLRSGPSTNDRIITILTRGQIIMPIGRNQAADWIKVQNATYSGWITTFLVAVNTDIETLPVLETP